VIRAFFKDGVIYTAPAVLSRSIGLLLFPLLTRALSPTDYGVVDLLTIAGILVNLTVALEISQGLGRYYSMTKDGVAKDEYASTALWFTIFAYSVFALAAAALAAPLASALLNGDVGAGTVRIAVAWIWLGGILYLLQEQLRWELRPKPYAITSLVNVVATAAGAITLVLVLDGGVGGLFAGQVLGTALATALALRYLRGTYRLRVDRKRLREMLIFSLPLVPASIGVFLSGFVDRVAIKAQLGLADVGIYGAAYRVAAIVGLVMVGFQTALLPLVLSRHAERETPVELAQVFRYFAGIAIVVFVVLSVLSDVIFTMIAPSSYSSGAELVPLLVLGAFFAGMYVFAPGMSIAGRTKPIATVSVLAGLANAALAFALVALFGIAGAAVATLVTSAAAFAALMAISQRLYPVPHDWRALGFAFAAAAAAVTVNQLLTVSGPLDGSGATEIAVKIVIIAVGAALVAALLVQRSDVEAFVALRHRGAQTPIPAHTLGPLADSAAGVDIEERAIRGSGADESGAR
jgi:O-antigen/teichoic acid export membrane protein